MKRSIFIAYLFGLIIAALVMVKVAADIKMALAGKTTNRVQILEQLDK